MTPRYRGDVRSKLTLRCVRSSIGLVCGIWARSREVNTALELPDAIRLHQPATYSRKCNLVQLVSPTWDPAAHKLTKLGRISQSPPRGWPKNLPLENLPRKRVTLNPFPDEALFTLSISPPLLHKRCQQSQ